MSNLRRPLVLGLSTCALLLMSSRVVKKNQASAARDAANMEPDNNEELMPREADTAGAKLHTEPAKWTD
ncbi:MAG TPA: hypothetical protein VG844_16755 [Terracidiphilus sp.]|nr:hypothetical protein [Terracidiphilus sp.]